MQTARSATKLSRALAPASRSIANRRDHITMIQPEEFDALLKKLRAFFSAKGFLEAHTQNRLSILAACEDPTTIATYNYAGQVWPMPQTGQMWLEYEMLQNPAPPGYFCLSTSYRNEPNPVPGRHDLIFPMFEFELKGGMKEMMQMEKELCEHLGFGEQSTFAEGYYDDQCKKFGVDELDHDHERQLGDESHIYLLKDFPEKTSPFWNMSRGGSEPGRENDTTCSKKCDVLIYGVETIGSAERSIDPIQMEKTFTEISGGQYANTLYAQFTKERVQSELRDFLSFNFFPRSGGGIGVTRLLNAMRRHGCLLK